MSLVPGRDRGESAFPVTQLLILLGPVLALGLFTALLALPAGLSAATATKC